MRREGKRLWERTLLEGAPYMLEKGLCTQAELDKLAEDLAAVAADETIAVALGPMMVTWAYKLGLGHERQSCGTGERAAGIVPKRRIPRAVDFSGTTVDHGLLG